MGRFCAQDLPVAREKVQSAVAKPQLFDRYSALHALAGASFGAAGQPLWKPIAVTIAWDILSPMIRSEMPGVLPQGRESAVNKAADIAVMMAGYLIVKKAKEEALDR